VISVKIKPANRTETLDFMKNQWQDIFPGQLFEYYFLDDIFERQFRRIEQSRKIFSYFSILAIFIACLGLYGMASFSAVQRIKEIGIRKVLGGTTPGIVALLGRELIMLILMANLAAWPLSFLAMKQWIQNFPYRTKIDILSFIGSSLIVLAIGLLTVSYQAIKAALASPVNSLRHE
jgi:putative ABC transport system permease protein